MQYNFTISLTRSAEILMKVLRASAFVFAGILVFEAGQEISEGLEQLARLKIVQINLMLFIIL